MIELRSEALVVRVDPDLGAEITHVGRPGGANVLFHEPWTTPLSVRRSAPYGDEVLDWLSDYRGGWQELVPNAGAACEVMGVRLPFHGEASRACWEVVDQAPEHVTMRTATRLPMVVTRSMRVAPNAPVLLIEEVITNESDFEVPFVWGHHPAFDVTPDTRIELPALTIAAEGESASPLSDLEPGAIGTWPNAPGRSGEQIDLSRVPEGRLERLCYAVAMSAGWAALRVPDRPDGVALSWDLLTFPHVWIWQQIAGPSFPWYGRASLTAIEPHSSWPATGLATAIENGRAHHLPPKGSRATWITLRIFEASGRPIAAVGRDGAITEEARA